MRLSFDGLVRIDHLPTDDGSATVGAAGEPNGSLETRADISLHFMGDPPPVARPGQSAPVGDNGIPLYVRQAVLAKALKGPIDVHGGLFEALAAKLEHAIEAFAQDDSGTINLAELHRAKEVARRGTNIVRNATGERRSAFD